MEIAPIPASQLKAWYTKSRKAPNLTAFVGISPPLARRICGVRDTLRRVDPRHIFALSRHLHVTVKELGWLGEDVKQDRLMNVLDVIREVAGGEPPFELEVAGVGVFPTVIYCKIGRGSEQVRRMNSELVERLGSEAASGPYDGEKMVPHVTVAHFIAPDAGPLIREAGRLANHAVGRMRVTEVGVRKWYPHRLFERPRPSGKMYEPLATFALGRG